MKEELKDYLNRYIKRYDLEPNIKYFRPEDFKDLQWENLNYFNKHGYNIRGAVYYYDNYKLDELIIFCHGLGPGHYPYMREIEYLCRYGYRVVAFDNTGCNLSEGKNNISLIEGLSNLDDFFKAYQYGLSKKTKIMIIGHSLGGLVALNSLALYPSICKVVSIAGVVSVKDIAMQNYSNVESILSYEKRKNPLYYNLKTYEVLNTTKADVLCIHSLDDQMVLPEYSINLIKENVFNNHVEYLFVNNKKHNPNYSEDAVNYMHDSFNKLNEIFNEEEKIQFLEGLDWIRMTNQDEEVFSKIIAFLERKN